jgi:hypothetical protein
MLERELSESSLIPCTARSPFVVNWVAQSASALAGSSAVDSTMFMLRERLIYGQGVPFAVGLPVRDERSFSD